MMEGGVKAGFHINYRESRFGLLKEKEGFDAGSVRGEFWNRFAVGAFSTGTSVSFKSESLSLEGSYADTSFVPYILYSYFDHTEKEFEVSGGIPFEYRPFNTLGFLIFLNFTWRRFSLHHGDVSADVSSDVLTFKRSELLLWHEAGIRFQSHLFFLLITFGIPLFADGKAEFARFYVLDRGATIVVQPAIGLNYRPEPPPFLRGEGGFKWRNMVFLLNGEVTGEWGGRFYGIERLEYRIEGKTAYRLGGAFMWAKAHHRILLGSGYRSKRYETLNIPDLNGETFFIMGGYERNSGGIRYGIFPNAELSELDYRATRKISVFLMKIGLDFSIAFHEP